MKATSFISQQIVFYLMIIAGVLFRQISYTQVSDTNSYWHLGLYDPDANFYQVKQKGWDYFNNHPELDTVKGTGFKDLLRWEQFWQDRVYEYENPNPGSLDISYEAMNDFLDTRTNYFQNVYNDGISWQFFGPDNLSTQTMGFVACIDVIRSGENYDTIFVGTNASGLFKTNDGGIHWFCVTDTIGLPGLGIQDVIVDPNNSHNIFIATGITTYGRCYGNGIYKSTDGGSSWQNIFPFENPERKVVYKLLIDPENSSRLFALINDEVYRTNDGGENWLLIFDLLTQPNAGNKKVLHDIEFKPGSEDTIYISSNGMFYIQNNITYYLTSEIWQCSNASDEENIIWLRIDDNTWPYNEKIELAVTAAAPAKVFACFTYKAISQNEKDTFAIFKTNDPSDEWNIHIKKETVQEYNYKFGGVDFWRNELIVSPCDTDVVYVGGFYITKITNNGQTLSSNYCGGFICQNFHVDIRELFLVEGSEPGTGGVNDVLLAGNDGGISRTTNGTQSWTNINGTGLTITQFYGLANAINIPQFISAGCQDNGWYLYRPESGSWKNKVEGDNYDCLVNNLSPYLSYSTTFGLTPKVVYTYDGGGSRFDEFPLQNEKTRPDWPFVMNQYNLDILFTGLREVYRVEKNNFDFNITAISDFVNDYQVDSGATLFALAVWEKDTNVIYAAYSEPTWLNDNCQEKKIFKTTDGGNNWTDLTCNLDFIQWLGITDILIDPDNHEKVWVTLGGFSSPAGTKRVIYSDDNFTTYQDISNGLPNLPVNCIKMASPDNHELFIANDAGVFYKNDTLENWMLYVSGTPVAIFSDLDINRKYNLIYAATFGRGIWFTEGTFPCPEYSYQDTISIFTDTIWDTELRLHHNLKIANGAKLTIQGTVYIGVDNKIMVEQGGTLILDGCLLTNSCNGEYWEGIEVWGNADKSQYQTSYQGKLELKNQAIIENASIAVATIKTDTTFHGTETAGGIITADDSYFRNNRIHLQFYNYANYYPWDSIYKSEIPNLSYFSDCHFTTGHPDDTLQFYGLKLDNVDGISFNRCSFKYLKEIDTSFADYNKSFVFLQNATNIIFSGCEFSNDAPYWDFYLAYLKRGIGLFSYNSSFSIIANDAEGGSLYTSFNKLNYGVKALCISSARTFTIDSCFFNLTSHGIYNSGGRYQTITSNTFNLPIKYATSQFLHYALYLDYCSQYHIEDNYIYSNEPIYYDYSIGMVINNSGEELNMIYRNYFNNLKYGIIAQNDNRGDDNDIGTGLKIKCNEFYNVGYNIAVTRDEHAYSFAGISIYQGFTGAADAPAGNRFSHINNPYSDYDNEQKNIIYFHHDTTQSPPGLNLVPWYYTDWSITKQNTYIGYNDTTSCKPTIETAKRESLYAKLLLEENEIDTSNNMLEIWIDGGSTEEIQQQIDYSTPPEANDLRNDLMAESPYLSDTVLVNAIEKEDVLTDALIRDVLVANPQSAKSSRIMDELNQRINPLPDYMMAEVEQGLFTVSQREMLEAELAYHIQERMLARNNLIHSYNSDTIPSKYDSLIAFYNSENDRMLKYDLAFLYAEENDSIDAYNTLDSISIVYDLSSLQQTIHQDYTDYFNLFLSGENNTIAGYEPDSSQISGLYLLANSSSIPVSSYARSILCVYDTMIYYEPIILPDMGYKSARNEISQKLDTENECFLKIYPNPAGNFFIVEYVVSEPSFPASLILTDLKGIKIKEIPLFQTHNKIVINTRNINPGVYFCNLVENNIIKELKKIVIFH